MTTIDWDAGRYYAVDCTGLKAKGRVTFNRRSRHFSTLAEVRTFCKKVLRRGEIPLLVSEVRLSAGGKPDYCWGLFRVGFSGRVRRVNQQ